MATFDVFLIIVIVISLIFSVFKGMVREIFSLLSLVAGYVVAVRYQGIGVDWLEKYITNDTLARLTCFGALFILTAATVSILGWYVKKLIHTSGALSGMDRLGGGVFGVVKGVLLMVLLMYPLQFYPDIYVKFTRGSTFAPHLRDLSNDLSRSLDAKGGFVEDLKLKAKEIKNLDIIQGLTNKDKKSVKKTQDEHTTTDQKELKDMLDSITNEG